MSGGFKYTPEAIQRWYGLMNKVDGLVAAGMDRAEAYMRVTYAEESADRQREQERKLAEIRELGT